MSESVFGIPPIQSMGPDEVDRQLSFENNGIANASPAVADGASIRPAGISNACRERDTEW
jgi:hypothetical protein